MSVTLDQFEKQVFTKVFCRLIRVDGSIDANEINFLKDFGTRYGISIEEIRSIIKETATDYDIVTKASFICELPKTLKLIEEMCMLANSDDNFSDKEMEFILQIADGMGVDIETIAEINDRLLSPLQEVDNNHSNFLHPDEPLSADYNAEFCFSQLNISTLKQDVFHVSEFNVVPSNKFSEKLSRLLSLRGVSV